MSGKFRPEQISGYNKKRVPDGGGVVFTRSCDGINRDPACTLLKKNFIKIILMRNILQLLYAAACNHSCRAL